MSKVRLYLDKMEVDVDPSVNIVESKQINKFFEVKDRQSNYTNSFNLLLTKKTEKVLDSIGLLGNISQKPYRYLRADVWRDGVQTIIDGSAHITETKGRKTVNIQIQDGNNSLYEFLGDKTLGSLDFSGVNHALNTSNYFNSFAHDYNNGYIYAVANYGFFDQNNIILNYQIPSLFCKWLWNKIFEESPFTFSYRGNTNVFESTEFKEQILTLDKGYLSQPSTDPEEKYLELSTGTDKVGTSYYAMTEIFDLKQFHSISSSPNLNESLIIPTENNYYKITVDGTILGSGTYDVIIEKDSNIFLYVVRNGTGLTNISFETIAYLTVGSALKIYVRTSNPTLQTTSSFNLKMFKDNSNAFVNFNAFFEDVKQKDFIKSVMQQFGLIHQREKGTKNYEFITLEELILSKKQGIDWSDKYQGDEFLTESYDLGGYGQTNWFKYRYDDEDDKFADGYFKIDDETINEENTLLTSPFKAPRSGSKIVANQILLDCNLFEPQFDSDGNLDTVEITESKPYLMRVNRVNGSFDWSVIDGAIAPYNGVIPIGSFRGLFFNELITQNYSSYIKTINRMYKVNAKFALSTIDILNLDLLKLVYVSQLGYYFYVNKINNYRPNKLTEVELIRIDVTLDTRLGEYSDDYNNDYYI